MTWHNKIKAKILNGTLQESDLTSLGGSLVDSRAKQDNFVDPAQAHSGTLLHYACQCGNAQTLQAIFRALGTTTAKQLAQRKDGRDATVFHHLAVCCHPQHAPELFTAFIDLLGVPDAKGLAQRENSDGRTVLHCLAGNRFQHASVLLTAFIELLGRDNATQLAQREDSDGATVLYHLAGNTSQHAPQLLAAFIDSIGQENTKQLAQRENSDGRTVLHHLASNDSQYAPQLLTAFIKGIGREATKQLAQSRDNSAWTALHCLASNDSQYAPQLLTVFIDGLGQDNARELAQRKDSDDANVLHCLARYNTSPHAPQLLTAFIDGFGQANAKELAIDSDGQANAKKTAADSDGQDNAKKTATDSDGQANAKKLATDSDGQDNAKKTAQKWTVLHYLADSPHQHTPQLLTDFIDLVGEKEARNLILAETKTVYPEPKNAIMLLSRNVLSQYQQLTLLAALLQPFRMVGLPDSALKGMADAKKQQVHQCLRDIQRGCIQPLQPTRSSPSTPPSSSQPITTPVVASSSSSSSSATLEQPHKPNGDTGKGKDKSSGEKGKGKWKDKGKGKGKGKGKSKSKPKDKASATHQGDTSADEAQINANLAMLANFPPEELQVLFAIADSQAHSTASSSTSSSARSNSPTQSVTDTQAAWLTQTMASLQGNVATLRAQLDEAKAQLDQPEMLSVAERATLQTSIKALDQRVTTMQTHAIHDCQRWQDELVALGQGSVRAFGLTLLSLLDQTIRACYLISSGQISRDRKTTQEKVGRLLKTLVESLPFGTLVANLAGCAVPERASEIASLCKETLPVTELAAELVPEPIKQAFSVVTDTLTGAGDKRTQRVASDVFTAFDITARAFEIAKLLTKVYRDIVQVLDSQGAETLAQQIVHSIIYALKDREQGQCLLTNIRDDNAILLAVMLGRHKEKVFYCPTPGVPAPTGWWPRVTPNGDKWSTRDIVRCAGIRCEVSDPVTGAVTEQAWVRQDRQPLQRPSIPTAVAAQTPAYLLGHYTSAQADYLCQATAARAQWQWQVITPPVAVVASTNASSPTPPRAASSRTASAGSSMTSQSQTAAPTTQVLLTRLAHADEEIQALKAERQREEQARRQAEEQRQHEKQARKQAKERRRQQAAQERAQLMQRLAKVEKQVAPDDQNTDASAGDDQTLAQLTRGAVLPPETKEQMQCQIQRLQAQIRELGVQAELSASQAVANQEQIARLEQQVYVLQDNKLGVSSRNSYERDSSSPVSALIARRSRGNMVTPSPTSTPTVVTIRTSSNGNDGDETTASSDDEASSKDAVTLEI